MKIPRLLISIIFLLLSIFIPGCNTQEEYKKINEGEEQKLIAFAEATIRSLPNNKISESEREILLRTNPVVSIFYTGNKTGRYTLTWNINQKTITYTGDGNIASPESSFLKINIISVDTNPLQ